MIIYNVTVKVDHDIHDDWMAWMKNIHIPEVLETGYFTKNEVAKVLVDESDGVTYSLQYRCKSMSDFEAYQKNEAQRLQNDHAERYKDKFVAFRTLLELVD